jgi:inhibitor of KinA sporulation pathway (predicted exonuclease)
VVIDFEATCLSERMISPAEIIQFPAVLMGPASRRATSGPDGLCVIGTFNTFVRPVHNPTLSQFCTNLTGITQEQVDSGVSFPDALHLFREWLRLHGLGVDAPAGRSFTVVTWGDWDLMCALPNQCDLLGIPYPPELTSWMNMKRVVSHLTGVHPRVSCKDVVTKYYGLQWIGQEHDGLSDATNVASLLPHTVGHVPPVHLPRTVLSHHGRVRWERITNSWVFGERNGAADDTAVQLQ